MKEKVEQSPWTIKKSEENEDITVEHDSVVIRDDIVSYEDCMQPVYHIIGEMDDGECLMLCSG